MQSDSKQRSSNHYSKFAQVLLPLALERPLTYGIETNFVDILNIGSFVEVELGRQSKIGVVWAISEEQLNTPTTHVKGIRRVLDQPVLREDLRQYVERFSRYNMVKLGMALRLVISREGLITAQKQEQVFRASGTYPDKMSPQRIRLFEFLKSGLAYKKRELSAICGVSISVIDTLVKQGFLLQDTVIPPPKKSQPIKELKFQNLSVEQKAAHLNISAFAEKNKAVLLEGVTGAGKTMVYMAQVRRIVKEGGQVLILMPEIALTTAFSAQFKKTYGFSPHIWHSGVGNSRLRDIWQGVAEHRVELVVGARSALFLPFANLKLIIVDEEHDGSYKQEERVIYNARDMAVLRGSIVPCSVILATATPSVETLVNVQTGRYGHVKLPERFGSSLLPEIRLIDMKTDEHETGKWLSSFMVLEMNSALEDKQQVLLYLNRRGYAPLTLCRKCGFHIQCHRCESWLVQHKHLRQLVCHHCGYRQPVPVACPECKTEDSLIAIGPGVERLKEEVEERFPQARVLMLSSDSINSMTQLHEHLNLIQKGLVDIIIGTQMVTKGHDYHGITMVGIVDADMILDRADPRASERTYQALTQVAGRAGRGEKRGIALVQTYSPEHPVMQALQKGSQDQFYELEIEQRRAYELPPFSRMASLIVSGRDITKLENFIQKIKHLCPTAEGFLVLGPAPCSIFRIRERYRFKFLIKCDRTKHIQPFISHWLSQIPTPKDGIKLVADIDPLNFH